MGHYKGPVYMRFAEVFLLVPINKAKAEQREELYSDKLKCFVWPELF